MPIIIEIINSSMPFCLVSTFSSFSSKSHKSNKMVNLFNNNSKKSCLPFVNFLFIINSKDFLWASNSMLSNNL